MLHTDESDIFPLTRKLAERIVALRSGDLGAAREGQVRDAFLDTLSVTVPGLSEAPAQIFFAAAQALGSTCTTPSLAMAGLLATAAHALDYDDVAFGGHPSAVIVPSVLVGAGLQGCNSGSLVLAAYLAGYETWGEIAGRESHKYHAKGLHPTGLIGPMAAAAAASVMLGLNADQCAAALAMAASAGAGLMVNFGSMTKPLHAGRACMAGLESAALARQGMTASDTAIEARSGFLQVFSPSGNVALAGGLRSLGVGDQWCLDREPPSVKRYPVCYAAHRCIDAAIALRALIPASFPRGIARLDAYLSPRNAEILRFRNPETPAQARFSLEYCIATALDRGTVGLTDLSGSSARLRLRQDWMGLIERVMVTEMDPVVEGFAKADWLDIVEAGGKHWTSPHIVRAKGHAQSPLSQNERREKALECLASVGIPNPTQDWFLSQIDALGKCSSCPAVLLAWMSGLFPKEAEATA